MSEEEEGQLISLFSVEMLCVIVEEREDVIIIWQTRSKTKAIMLAKDLLKKDSVLKVNCGLDRDFPNVGIWNYNSGSSKWFFTA